MGSKFTKTYFVISYRGLSLALIALCVLFGSCKKKRAFKEEDAQITADVRMVQGQIDDVLKDINIVIMNRSLLRGKPDGGAGDEGGKLSACGFRIDTSVANQGIISLRYDSSSCNGVKRMGTVMFSIQSYPTQKWKHQGCVMKIDFTAYKGSRISDGRNIQLNGSVYLTNYSGKTWYDIVYYYEPSISQILTGNGITATFGGSETSVFNFNRRMTYTFSKKDSVVSCSIDGLGSSDGEENLENWGQGRQGQSFCSRVDATLLWKSSCSANVLYSGEEVFVVADKEFDIHSTFGVDENGDAMTSNATCPYGWKASWSYKKKTKSRVLNYN